MPNKTLIACALLAVTSSAFGQQGDAGQHVRDLLDLDARRALAAEQGKDGANTPLAAAPTTSAPVEPAALIAPRRERDSITVTAIYGTTGNLTAIVNVNGMRKVYASASRVAAGDSYSAGTYALSSISGECVTLQKLARASKKPAAPQTFCYSPHDPQELTLARDYSGSKPSGPGPNVAMPFMPGTGPQLGAGPVIIPAPMKR